MGTQSHSVSVLVLTKNEEVNISACLASLSFSDDVVVYDSLSTDRTVELARQHSNVTVVQRPFDDWSTHQNWAVRNIRFKHPWVLYVDADERVEPELAREVGVKADPQSPYAAFRLRRRDMFMGRWLRHAQLYPTWIIRLFRPERIRYERLVNPKAVVDGPIADLEGHLAHYPFSKGIDHWFERHNSYSTFEAMELLKVRTGAAKPLRALLTRDTNERRAALKDLFYRMPMRPQIKWVYYMVWRRAWLDGRPGMMYARMTYLYEYMITLKAQQMRLERRNGSAQSGRVADSTMDFQR